MASSINLLHISTILFILISLFTPSYSQTSTNNFENEDENEDEYVLDTPFANTRLRSRFLASIIKKGTTCSQQNKKVCDGVSANKGKSLLYCCKKHCRDILGDKNNCGACGHKCRLGERCCGGKCTNVAHNDKNCGKCNKACAPGIQCHYGFCGYA